MMEHTQLDVEAEVAQLRHRRRLRVFQWHEVSQLEFPGYFVIHQRVGADGLETLRLLIAYAASGPSLQRMAGRAFGQLTYHLLTFIRPGVLPLDEYEELVPATVRRMLDGIANKEIGHIPGVRFEASLQKYYSVTAPSG